MKRWAAGAVFIIVVLWLLSMSAWGHDIYTNWVNKQGVGCCNRMDCAPLAEANERQSAVGAEVRIEGQWCPVLAHHYLKTGNAPDWSTAHVCVRKQYVPYSSLSPCDRLLCYQPRPGI